MERLASRQRSLRQGQLPLLKRLLPLAALLLGLTAPSGAAEYPPEILELGRQALTLAQQGRFEQSVPFWERLQQWQSQHLGSSDPRSLRGLRNLAGVYLGAGFPQKAATSYQRYLTLVASSAGANSTETALARLDLAKALRTLAQFDQAEELVHQALAILQRQPASPSIQIELANGHEVLGTIAHERGLYPLAEQEHRQALQLRQNLRPADPMAIANSTANMAQALLRQGQFAKAIDLQEQALASYRRMPTVDSRGQQSTVLANIGLSHDLLGNPEAALTALQEALPMRLAVSGPNHPESARLLLNLGALEVASGSVTTGLDHYRQGLKILEQRMGANHISTGFAIQRMAELARDLGQSDNALAWYSRVLAIRRQQLRPDHPDIATTLLGMALSELHKGQRTLATKHLQEALSIRQKAFGDRHPYTAMTRLLLGMLAWDDGDQTQARQNFDAVVVGYTQFLRGEAALLPISERRRLLATVQEVRNVLAGLSLHGANGRETALTARINLNGLLEELERRQSTLLQRNTANRQKLAALNSLTNTLARMELSDGERQRMQAQRDALERDLFNQLEAGTGTDQDVVSKQTIAAALPRDGVLVEFLRFDPVRFQQGALQNSGEGRYAALVLKPDGSVSAVNLGAAAEINRAIRQALIQTQRIDPGAERAWAKVSEQIIQPLLPEIGSRKKWYVSPDGELHRVPFAALGSMSAGVIKPYSDSYHLRLVTSARDLLADETTQTQHSKSLVLADPDFNAQLSESSTTPAVRTINTGNTQRGSDPTDLWRSLRWSRLPGSRMEGAAISTLTSGQLLTDSTASASALYSVKSPQFLHIASHGAFLPRPQQASSDKAGSNRLQALEGKQSSTSDPMLRGVVLLAGANRLAQGPQDDGVMTALEFSKLNLQGTKLVTLSACDTGVGAVEVGDGIYGLRRSLAVAGVRSSVLSLWKVSDQATAVFMGAFYQQLQKGLSPEAALHEAQNRLRQHNNKSWRHPYYWAAFQLYGRSW